MHYECNYKVKSVTKTADGETFDASQHVRSGTGKYRHISDIRVPEGIDLEPNDVVRLKIENHSEESGRGSRSWALERFIGFPYDRERAGWHPLDGYED